jgi:DNA-binding NtrC family response regulator
MNLAKIEIETSILLASRDPSLVAVVRGVLGEIGPIALESVRDSGDLPLLIRRGRHDLVIVHADWRFAPRQLAGALQAAGVLRKPVPIVVLDETYDVDRATTLFRMGVTDYLGLDEHGERLSAVVRQLAPPTDPDRIIELVQGARMFFGRA